MVHQQEKMNRMSEYSTTISILEIKTNQMEFDGYIDKRINQDLVENLTKEDHRWLLITLSSPFRTGENTNEAVEYCG
jgi:hypothetical protein